MSEYTPNKWEIVRLQDGDKEPVFKVLGGWSGGYLDGDSWRMSSGLEEDAERHLRLNHYHYSKNAHTYVDHAWRAPELKQFFEALFKEFNVDQGGWR